MSLTWIAGSARDGRTSSSSSKGAGDGGRERARESGPRLDIQGLRAVAVLAVIAEHLFGWPLGGFVGVDVFFVISGFLITGLLIREWKRTGTISFANFYARRVKRILPASLVVIVATLISAYLLFANPRLNDTVTDSVWAALFSANWRFLLQGTDYFQADGPVSPLRHYWSLAVEEQFYFVWPWVMLAALVWMGRKGMSSSRSLKLAGALIAAASLISFIWATGETAANPGSAYYSSFTRAWELGAGAMLAFAAPLCRRIPEGVRPVLANLGLVGVGASIFFLTPHSMFPAPGALLPVLSTVTVIAAGCGGQQKFLYVLTNPVSRYLGDISFSLYLWHFPVIVFLGLLLATGSKFYYLMVLFVTLGLSIYSYRFVEDPIRKSAWLSSKSPDRPTSVRGDGPTPGRRTSLLRPLAGLVAFALVAVGAIAFKVSHNEASAVVAPASKARAGFPQAPVAGPAGAALQTELKAAVPASSWPHFEPSLEELMSKDPHPDRVLQCGEPGIHSAQDCTFGPKDATKHAVLVGDSISQRWAFPLTRLYAQNGWNIRIFGRPGCPFNDYPMVKSDEEQARCNERKQQAIDFVQQSKPDLLIIGNTMVPERMSTTGQVATAQDWQAGMESILSKASGSKSRLILSPPPFDKDVRECYSPVNGPADCLGTVTSLWYEVARADLAAAVNTSSVYLDTRALFCTPDDACPEFAGNVPVKKDHTHFTLPYGYHIQDALRELLDSKNLL
ncbi:acyltransferase family protein [Pseudarthrobacter enclensis]|uniref:acyltransferase family protein n=1 Tax=Pseudarthrobacter enclensis TaxID=993070 RepID=UPI0034294256